ncbi:acyl carrier protein [Streptomyces syringium]|uniref:Acyl carrier protein n=1 Tax=Streptomyces syringium TaxID=76729 RepID=A0ABS4YCK5_9ACTN|nr:acyl carrier protein [Streptomyces syringium]MBP2406523.1 acyl carrier protein [Streptomyces syringium]
MPGVYDAVFGVLTGTLAVPPAEVGPQRQLDALHLDSLARAELALTLKELLGVPCSDHDVPATATVGGLAALLDDRLADRTRAPGGEAP